ncbi:MAG TPA: restriction endonuclease [Chloroflexia bacterium]
MARIRDSKGRSDENSGYTRLIGNRDLGQLLSQVQATVIRSGNELEKILQTYTRHAIVSEVELTGPASSHQDVTEIVFDPQLKFTDRQAIRADILITNHKAQTCQIIELKDGDTFDTKKASGELESLKRFAAEISRTTGYVTTYHFCSFNQPDKMAIIRGAKGRFSLEEVMTGNELCELLGIDFQTIVEYRVLEQQENLSYFLDRLVAIPEIQEGLTARLSVDM